MSENASTETRYASGVALVNVVASGPDAGTVLDAWFPAPALTQTPIFPSRMSLKSSPVSTPNAMPAPRCAPPPLILDEAPEDAVDGYLRLHLLSHTLVRPNDLNLEGLFGHLANVAWTNHGPVLATELNSSHWACGSWGI